MIGIIVVAVMTKLDARKAEKAVKSASDAASLAAKVAKDTHTLVNSNMGVQLASNAEMAGRLASLPDATAEDKEIARAAKQALLEHQQRQAIVDNRNAN